MIKVKFQVIPISSDAPKVLQQREMNEKLKTYYFKTKNELPTAYIRKNKLEKVDNY